jgi:hypothetical protein
MFNVIESLHLDTAPPNALHWGDVSGCGEHAELLLRAIESGDWREVAMVADKDPDEREAA